MNKHARPTLWEHVEQQEPKHSAGWSGYIDRTLKDYYSIHRLTPYTPGKHAKPFGKHHPATPVTYNSNGNVTPLRPTTYALDVAA